MSQYALKSFQFGKLAFISVLRSLNSLLRGLHRCGVQKSLSIWISSYISRIPWLYVCDPYKGCCCLCFGRTYPTNGCFSSHWKTHCHWKGLWRGSPHVQSMSYNSLNSVVGDSSLLSCLSRTCLIASTSSSTTSSSFWSISWLGSKFVGLCSDSLSSLSMLCCVCAAFVALRVNLIVSCVANV